MERKGTTTWNAAVTSGGISTRMYMACVIAALAPDMFTEGLAANVAGQGSSLGRHGMNNEFVARNKELRNVRESEDNEA